MSATESVTAGAPSILTTTLAQRAAGVPRERLERLQASALAALREAAATGRAVFTTSLGPEDQVIGELIARERLPITLATLDTGRLFPETYTLIEQSETRWRRRIHIHMPDTVQVVQWVQVNGINAFRDSRAQRQDCCHLRKLVPLAAALAGASAWVTGLRADQSGARADTPVRQFDTERALEKFAPLSDWHSADVWAFLQANDVPWNPLHDAGFASIGCAPCTRAIGPDEPERAGRWWWEQDAARECGLHVGGAASRVVAAPGAA